MKCPYQLTYIGKDKDGCDIPYFGNCLEHDCRAWEIKARFNYETKEYDGDCRAFMLDRKILGGINR
jgi:hypothetical protein